MRPTMLAALAAATLAQGCGNALADYQTRKPDAQVLHVAMKQLTDVIVYDIFSPPQASRAYAYSSVAAYEVLRQGDSTYRTLAGQLNGLEPVPVPAAGVQVYLPLAGVHAFITVGRQRTFSRARMDTLRAAMHERYRKMGVPPAVADSSIAYGERVAQHILAWSAKDKFAQTRGYPKYTVTPQRGRWVPTPPAYMDAVEPNWAQHRPFTLDSASQFKPKPPHPFDLTPGSPFYVEAREVFTTGKSLSTEQRSIAAFWDCNPYVMNVRGHAMFATKKITPGGHWMGIVGLAATADDADLMRSAEAYALTAVALADGFLSSWDEKYRSNLIRPETVINEAFDENWTPLLQTPPFPEYTSGHSVISTAAAEVLTTLFGENFAFRDTTEQAYGLPARSFTSFRQAAAEAAISRLYGGIHYRRAIEEGVVQGRRVGQHVVARIHTRNVGAVAQRPDSATRAVH